MLVHDMQTLFLSSLQELSSACYNVILYRLDVMIWDIKLLIPQVKSDNPAAANHTIIFAKYATKTLQLIFDSRKHRSS